MEEEQEYEKPAGWWLKVGRREEGQKKPLGGKKLRQEEIEGGEVLRLGTVEAWKAGVNSLIWNNWPGLCFGNAKVQMVLLYRLMPAISMAKNGSIITRVSSVLSHLMTVAHEWPFSIDSLRRQRQAAGIVFWEQNFKKPTFWFINSFWGSRLLT